MTARMHSDELLDNRSGDPGCGTPERPTLYRALVARLRHEAADPRKTPELRGQIQPALASLRPANRDDLFSPSSVDKYEENYAGDT